MQTQWSMKSYIQTKSLRAKRRPDSRHLTYWKRRHYYGTIRGDIMTATPGRLTVPRAALACRQRSSTAADVGIPAPGVLAATALGAMGTGDAAFDASATVTVSL